MPVPFPPSRICLVTLPAIAARLLLALLGLSLICLIWHIAPSPLSRICPIVPSHLSVICLIVPSPRPIPCAARPVCLPRPAPTDRALPARRNRPIRLPHPAPCASPTDRALGLTTPPDTTSAPFRGVWCLEGQAQCRAVALPPLDGLRPSSPLPPDLWYPSANAHQPNRPMNSAEQTQLRDLLTQGRVLALAVLVEGLPYAGLLPFAAPPDLSHLLILASGLAAHTQGLSDGAPYSALIHQPDRPSLDPHQVPRVTLRGAVQRLPRDVPPYAAARAAYLGKFPASEQLFGLGDFNLYALQIESARYVAGFGRAFTLSAARLRETVGGA